MKKIIHLALAMSLVAFMAAPALAGLAVDFTGVTLNMTSDNWSLGWKFTTNGPITVQALGFYDYQKNGLTENHDVGIFDAAGNLLVSTTVLTTDPLVSWFRMHTITPLVLPGSETFYIQAVTGTENYTSYTTGFTVDPSINFIQDAWKSGAGGVLAFPDSSYGITAAAGGGIFGPNFSATAAPVPASLILLGSGLAGLIGIRRRPR